MICKESKKGFKLFNFFFFFFELTVPKPAVMESSTQHFKKACIFSCSIVVQTEARQAFT